jgi:hypothetical protein
MYTLLIIIFKGAADLENGAEDLGNGAVNGT